MKQDTDRSPQHWKRKTAMAIGRPELATASDEELEKAHDDHQQAIKIEMEAAERAGRSFNDTPTKNLESKSGSMVQRGMPPGPASVSGFPNEAERRRETVITSLVNEAVHRQGIPRDEARNQVKILHPELFPKKLVPGRPRQEVVAEEKRREEILSLANEAMSRFGRGEVDDYERAWNLVRSENPHLFPRDAKKK